MSYSPIEILARGVYVKNGKLLLCHTKGARNTYLPGGHVEFLEQSKKTLAREIAEELGKHVKVGRFLGAVEHTFLQKTERHCEINFVFQMDIPGLTPPAEPFSLENYIEFLWADVSRLSDYSLQPAMLTSLLTPWLKSKEKIERWATAYPKSRLVRNFAV